MMNGFQLAPRMARGRSEFAITHATPGDVWGAIRAQEILNEQSPRRTSTIVPPVEEMVRANQNLGRITPEDVRELRLNALRVIGANTLLVVARHYERLPVDEDDKEKYIEMFAPTVEADRAAMKILQSEDGTYQNGMHRLLTTLPLSLVHGPQFERPKQVRLTLVDSDNPELNEIFKQQ